MTLAGPGHIRYPALAGYYLGVARFNGDNYGPLVVKGLLVVRRFQVLVWVYTNGTGNQTVSVTNVSL